ncbi:MAG: two-component sensor histidine kinase, partial [Myxococcota bacterium]
MFRTGTYLRTLSARLLLHIALPLFLLLGVSGALVMGALERQFERRMQEDVEMVARALQKPVSHALERQREGSLRSALESALDIGRVYGAYLYSDEGALLASLGTVEGRQQPAGVERLRQRPRGGGSYGVIQGEPVYSYFVPVRLGGDRGTGLLQITRRKSDIDTFMGQLRWGGFSVLLIFAILMTVTVIFGYQVAAGAALQRLHASMARIRAG